MRTKKTRSLRRTKSTTEMGKYLDPSTGDLGMSDDSAFSDVTKKVSLGTLCVYISGTGNFRHPCVTWLQATQMFPRDSSLGRVEHNVPFLSLSPSGKCFRSTDDKQKWLSLLSWSPSNRRNTTFRAFSRRQMSVPTDDKQRKVVAFKRLWDTYIYVHPRGSTWGTDHANYFLLLIIQQCPFQS